MENPIYKFMKENGLTQKDEATFMSEYSDRNKAAQLHKFMVDNKLTTKGADDFYNEYFSTSKKKVSTDSSEPAAQPGKPSAPSTGQSAFDAWNPAFKKDKPEDEPKVERESQFAPKQLDGAYDTWRKSITKEARDYGVQIGYEKTPEEDEISALRKAASDQLGKKSYTPEEQKQIQEVEDKIKKGEEVEVMKPEMGVGTGWRLGEFSLNNSPEDVADFYRKASESGLDDESANILNLTNRKAEGSFYGESQMASRGYAEKAANLWFDMVSEKDPSKANYLREKYNKLKSTPENERSSEDEKFLRDTEGRAIELHAAGKSFRLNRVAERINDLNGRAVTDQEKVELDNLFEEYGKLDNSLMGMEKADKLNRMQYGYISRVEAAEDEWKQDRYNKLSQGDGKLSQFFQSALGAIANGFISIGQVPKVFGDLIGDDDYDYSDELYDSIQSTKRGMSAFYNDLPQGKRSSDLPFTARLALVGGNAVGSASLFIGGGLLGGASRVGQTAATFGTAFLTSEADYYQEALDAGMDSQSAALFGTYLAAQSAALESIIPDVKYLKTPEFRRSVRNSVMKRFTSGMPLKESMKFGYKDALKTFAESGVSYLKTGTKEAFIEELPTQFAEDLSKTAANALGQKKYFNDTFDGDSYVDAILGSFVAGPSMNLLSRPQSKSPVQEEVIREIAERKDKLLKKGTASDKMTQPDSRDAIENAAEILDGMKAHSGWNTMSREEQNHALATAQQIEVMKKEQERMKELGIPDERKEAEIKKLEDEVNEMFSIQMEQAKQKAKDAKLKAIEDEFNKSMQGEEFPVQEDERDAEIVELQKQREERGVNEVDTFFSDMKPMVPFAVERMEQGQPVAQSVKEASSNYLYKKYKELTDMKSDPNRMMTRQQISNIQKQLEQDIRTLEGTTEAKPVTNDQENIQGIPSEVGVGQEPVQAQPVETTGEEAPPAGGILQTQEKQKYLINNPKKILTPLKSKYSVDGGDCYQIAIAINDVFGGDFYAIVRDDEPEYYHHVAIKINGKYYDGTGVRSESEILSNFSGYDSDTERDEEAMAIPVTKEDVIRTAGRASVSLSSVDKIKDELLGGILQAQEEVTPQVTEEVTPEPQKKQPLRKRVASLFETSEGEKSAEKVGEFLKEANIDVEVLDPKDFDEKGSQRNFEGDADGVFLVDNNTGKIYLNRERIKTAEGKVIAFHEGIHPVINIIRNTNPKQYQAIVDGLKAEAARNEAVAEAAAAVASSEEYQRRGPESIEDETVVETMARVAAGDIDIDTFEPTFREKFIEFMNKIAKALGIGPIAVNSPRMEVQRLAKQLTAALNEGGKISDIVGKKNVGKFQNELAQPRITAGEVLSKERAEQKKVTEVADTFEKAVDNVLDPSSDPADRVKRFLENAYEDLRYFFSEYSGDTGLDWYTNKVKEFDAKLRELSDIAISRGEMSKENSLSNEDNMNLFRVVLALSSIGVNPRENVKAAFSIWKTFDQNTKTFSKYQPGQVSIRTNIDDGKGGYLAPSGIIEKETNNFIDIKQANGKVVRVKKSDLAKEFDVTYRDKNGKEQIKKGIRIFKTGPANTIFRKGNQMIKIPNEDILDQTEIDNGIKGKGWTTKGNVVVINLERVEKLLASTPTVKDAIDWLNSKHPIAELREYNPALPDVEGGKGKINPKGERIGSYIIGEKLGAFHQNVAGTPTELTMDLWWSRTWNRYMGTLMITDEKGEPAIQETPRTDSERNIMREAAAEAANSLGLEVHELQAALWYLEQQVYKRMGAAVESYSFVDGVNQLLLKYGKTDEEIQPERYGVDSSETEKRREAAATRAADIIYGKGGEKGAAKVKQPTKPTVAKLSKGIKRGKRPTKAEVNKYLSEQEFFRSTSPFAWAVDPVSEETLKKSTIVENDGTYGVVTEDGDIKGVFNPNSAKQREGVPAKKNTLAGLIPKAIKAGGIKLDNFDGRLTELYSKNGFRKVSSVPFNEEYAPEGWSKERDGTPDVVAMVYDPDNKLDIEEKKFEDYGEAMSYRDSFVDQAREEADKKAEEEKMIATTSRDKIGTQSDRDIANYASSYLNKYGPYTKANVVQVMKMSPDEKIKLINDAFEAKVKKMNPAFREPGNNFYDQAAKNRDKALALVKKPTVQPSTKIPRGKGATEMIVNGQPVQVKPLPEGTEVINGFYSPIEKNLRETKAEKQSANKWLTSGLIGKGDEAVYTGVKGWLESKNPQEQVSKQDILDFMKNNRIQLVEVVKEGIADGDIASWGGTQAQFHEYQLEGEKSNYKEVLVTLPSVERASAKVVMAGGRPSNGFDVVLNGKILNEEPFFTRSDANDFVDEIDENKGKKDFISSHFDEPNILVHLRMNTRYSQVENKDYLNPKTYKPNFDTAFELIDNVDNYQVKKIGSSSPYFNTYSKKILSDNNMSVDDLKNYLMEYDRLGKNHPDFQDNKKNIPIKVLFLEEVQSDWGQTGKREGFVGDKQKELFNQFKYEVPSGPFVTDTNAWTKLGLKFAIQEAVKQGAEKIAWTTGEQQNERYDLSKQIDEISYLETKEKGIYDVKATKNKVTQFADKQMDLNKIESTFGKDIAEKISNGVGEVKRGITFISGERLKMGGKGMIGFYGSVEEGKEGIVGGVAKALVKDLTGKPSEIGETKINNSNQASIDITPELKAAVQRGIPQFSAKIPRTQAQVREAAENAIDAVEEAIADGMSPQQAIDENISNQDWYGDLTPAQKEQLNNILQDEFGVTASEPKLQNNAQRVADLWEKGGKEAKAEIKNILETDPELSYIYNNFPKITKQLEEQGLLTKTENCP